MLPFDPSYPCQYCSDEMAYTKFAPTHRYGTRLGNKHLKEPDNHMELTRLKKLAKDAKTELKL